MHLTLKNLEIKRLTKGDIPKVPFFALKNKILRKNYDLSIVFTTPAEMRVLSQKFKGNKDHKNILSFPLDTSSGEIIISLKEVRSEAKNFDRNYKEHLKYIVIHGMLHLAGLTHGSKMESEEKRLMSNRGF